MPIQRRLSRFGGDGGGAAAAERVQHYVRPRLLLAVMMRFQQGLGFSGWGKQFG